MLTITNFNKNKVRRRLEFPFFWLPLYMRTFIKVMNILPSGYLTLLICFFVSAKNCQNQSLILTVKSKREPEVKAFFANFFTFKGTIWNIDFDLKLSVKGKGIYILKMFNIQRLHDKQEMLEVFESLSFWKPQWTFFFSKN